MASREFGKRNFLKVTGGALVALVFGQRAMAQNGNILGVDLPRVITDLIPRKPMAYLRMADAVINLEREADRKGLPESSLAFGDGTSLADLTESLYRMAMPRLVALIDRSEATDPGFADKAGALLAELHRNQYELPDALRLLSLGTNTPMSKGIRFVQDEQAQPTIIFQSGVSPVPDKTPPAAVDAVPEADEEPDVPIKKSRDYASLKSEYARLFRTLTVRPQFADSAKWHLDMMLKSRERYRRVEKETGVPWHFIAATHALEASFDFRAHLHNGDFPLTARTRQVPAGRPSQWLPPSDWESSAKDALRLLGFTKQTDWTLERTLYRLEAYNGLGYRGIGIPSPYLWSFSNHYERGKFVADGKFSATARSQQCGAAVMLKLLENAGEVTWPEM